ncbi:MAG TPA: carboxypeptidase-like regulatory domain-containing protein [Pyrinomonadaceae bacterium]|nr:carboxypeptidase-like regulatory domain-containing protein [Pyrinomonadaceae bacterium]
MFLTTLLSLVLLAAVLPLNPTHAQDKPQKGKPPATTPTPDSTTTSTPTSITFDPADPSVAPGAKVTITATMRDQAGKEVKDADVQWVVPGGLGDVIETKIEGNKITVIGLTPTAENSHLTSNLAPLIAQAVVEKKTFSNVVNVRLQVLPVARGPIPPGLKPQVDIMWSVLPKDVTGHNFGRAIRNSYYAVEVVIGNNTGYDLQVASVGFDLPDDTEINNIVPSAGFRVSRATGERARALYPRNIALNVIRALGPVFTGFTPFFKNEGHRANFTQGVNIFSNPLEKGFELVVPDLSIDELNRLQDQLLRDDITTRTVIPNNTQVRTMVLVPKRFLNIKEGQDRDDPQTVMKHLGNLVLKGDRVDYLNRVRVVAMPAETGEFSISGRVTDGCNNGLQGVSIRLTGGSQNFADRSATTDSRGNYSFDNIPANVKYTVIPKSGNLTFMSPDNSRAPGTSGLQSFVVDQNMTNVNFQTTQEKYTVSGKITLDDKPLDSVKIIIKKGSDTVKTEPAEIKTTKDGIYTVSLPAGSIYTVTPELKDHTFTPPSPTTQLLNCDQKNLDFKATATKKETTTPTPTPAATPKP